MKLWLLCALLLTASSAYGLCQEKAPVPVNGRTPAAKLEFRPVPQLDDGTWSTRDATAGDPISASDWGFEEIIKSSTGKPVTAQELDDKLFKKPPLLDGSKLKPNTRAELYGSQAVIHFEFQDDAKETFKEYTGTHIGKHLGIFYDHKLISAPIINDVIPGVGIIEGNFTPESAKALADQLNGGTASKSDEQTGVKSLMQSPIQTLVLVAGGIGLVLLPILYFWSRRADKPARPVEEVGGDR